MSLSTQHGKQLDRRLKFVKVQEVTQINKMHVAFYVKNIGHFIKNNII